MADSIPSPCPNSFSITAMRFPCADVKMWFSSVVFPDNAALQAHVNIKDIQC